MEALSSSLKELSSSKCFGGLQKTFSHQSEVTNSTMKFSVFLPPKAVESPSSAQLPVLYLLPGYGCDQETPANLWSFQKAAADCGLVVVTSDTSPRNVPLDEKYITKHAGPGAAFYLDATEEPFKPYYQMYSYVSFELPALIEAAFPFVIKGNRSICGHSMGGHGALISALRNPGKFASVSVLSALAAPGLSPNGPKTFGFLLGKENKESWKENDAFYLVQSYKGPKLRVLVDQGLSDHFRAYFGVEKFAEACKKNEDIEIEFREHEGYGHDDNFIKSFIEDHIAFHHKACLAKL